MAGLFSMEWVARLCLGFGPIGPPKLYGFQLLVRLYMRNTGHSEKDSPGFALRAPEKGTGAWLTARARYGHSYGAICTKGREGGGDCQGCGMVPI